MTSLRLDHSFFTIQLLSKVIGSSEHHAAVPDVQILFFFFLFISPSCSSFYSSPSSSSVVTRQWCAYLKLGLLSLPILVIVSRSACARHFEIFGQFRRTSRGADVDLSAAPILLSLGSGSFELKIAKLWNLHKSFTSRHRSRAEQCRADGTNDAGFNRKVPRPTDGRTTDRSRDSISTCHSCFSCNLPACHAGWPLFS